MSVDEQVPSSASDAKRQAKSDMAAAKARAKAERPLWKKKRFIVPAVLVLVGVIAVAGSGGDDEAELVADEAAAATTSETDGGSDEGTEDSEATEDSAEGDVAEGFGVGETIAMGELEHTFHSARFVEGDEFFSPDEGTAWLVVDVEVTNNGDESEAISSMLMWNLIDSENRSADQTITTDEQGSVDGELGADRSMRGEIAYEVDADETEWELVFEPNFLGFGQGIYTLTADDVA